LGNFRRTVAAWLGLNEQSYQSQTSEAKPTDFQSLEVLSEELEDTIEAQASDMTVVERLSFKGFSRSNNGQTRFAGQPYKLLLVANPKGGVGKSSLSVLLTAFSGLERVLFADIDPQQSTKLAFEAIFGEEATSNSLLEITDLGDIEKVIRKVAGQPKRTILIDTPAGMTPDAIAKQPLVSLLLVPVSSSAVEMRATFNFISGLLAKNYTVPILIVPNKIDDNSDLLRIIAEFGKLPCMLATPIPYDKNIERLLAEQQFPGQLSDLRKAAFPLIRSVNNAIKSSHLPASNLRQID
jgi:cellulose biosynthesis protein BcsQ